MSYVMFTAMANEALPIIAAIDAFVADHEMSPVTFGRLAMNDPHFVADVRKGRRLWPETEAKVRKFIREYRRPSRLAAA